MACFAGALAVLGCILGDPATIPSGLRTILYAEGTLITDYMALAGPAAAFANSALVTLSSILLLWGTRTVVNGYTPVEIGLMAGFALFGKNILNIWPIILGTFLFAKIKKEPFRDYVAVALLATSLAPLVSYVSIDNGWGDWWGGVLLGILIGALLPTIAAYTYKIQNGANLYNMGFACGLIAMVLFPVMKSLGAEPASVDYWAQGYNLPLGIFLALLCGLLILTGLFFSGKPVWASWAGYRRLLRTTGRAPSDFLRMFGGAPVLINTGVNGLIATAAILLVGGDLNGPTLGGIFTVMGFSSYGKHAGNIVPVMSGVVLGGILMSWSITDHGAQLAILFCTTLAPISGYFGWPFGVLAGFLHSAVVLLAGLPLQGVNLYNNGFSGGLVAIVLYPLLSALVRHRRAILQEGDYFEVFQNSAPIIPPLRPENRSQK